MQLYLDGLLPADERDAIESHALACSVCRDPLALAATSGSDRPPPTWFRRGCEKLDAQSCLDAAARYSGGHGIATDEAQAASLRRAGCSIRPDQCPASQ